MVGASNGYTQNVIVKFIDCVVSFCCFWISKLLYLDFQILLSTEVSYSTVENRSRFTPSNMVLRPLFNTETTLIWYCYHSC